MKLIIILLTLISLSLTSAYAIPLKDLDIGLIHDGEFYSPAQELYYDKHGCKEKVMNCPVWAYEIKNKTVLDNVNPEDRDYVEHLWLRGQEPADWVYKENK